MVGCATQAPHQAYNESEIVLNEIDSSSHIENTFLNVFANGTNTSIKAINPNVAIISRIDKFLEREINNDSTNAINRNLRVLVDTTNAELKPDSNGKYLLITQFSVSIQNSNTGTTLLTDSCLVQDASANNLTYFQEKFAIELNRHLDIHANRCAEKNISTIQQNVAQLYNRNETPVPDTKTNFAEAKPSKTDLTTKSNVPFIEREGSYFTSGIYISVWDHKNDLDNPASEYEFDLISSESRFKLGSMNSNNVSFFIEGLFDFPFDPLFTSTSTTPTFYYGAGLSGGAAFHPTGRKYQGVSLSTGYKYYFTDVNDERSKGAVMAEAAIFSKLFKQYGIGLFARVDHHFKKEPLGAANGINYGLAITFAQ